MPRRSRLEPVERLSRRLRTRRAAQGVPQSRLVPRRCQLALPRHEERRARAGQQVEPAEVELRRHGIRRDKPEAVAIDEVKRFIADHDLNAETRFIPPVVAPPNHGGFDEKVAIIGGGPAGLSAAIEAAGYGAKVVLADENERMGGQLYKQIHKFFGSESHFAGTRGFEIAKILIKDCCKLCIRVKLLILLTEYCKEIFS